MLCRHCRRTPRTSTGHLRRSSFREPPGGLSSRCIYQVQRRLLCRYKRSRSMPYLRGKNHRAPETLGRHRRRCHTCRTDRHYFRGTDPQSLPTLDQHRHCCQGQAGSRMPQRYSRCLQCINHCSPPTLDRHRHGWGYPLVHRMPQRHRHYFPHTLSRSLPKLDRYRPSHPHRRRMPQRYSRCLHCIHHRWRNLHPSSNCIHPARKVREISS